MCQEINVGNSRRRHYVILALNQQAERPNSPAITTRATVQRPSIIYVIRNTSVSIGIDLAITNPRTGERPREYTMWVRRVY